MKKIILFTLAVFSTLSLSATIRRVNNNVGVVTVAGLVYNNFNSAYNDAVNGDTLYIEPSVGAYNIVNPIAKRLVIIGNGYLISNNASLQSPLPYNVHTSSLTAPGDIFVNAGAENSIFIGIVFLQSIMIGCGNVVVERSEFGSLAKPILNSSNNIIKKCKLRFFSVPFSSISGNGSLNIISNCIIPEGIINMNNIIIDQCVILGALSGMTNATVTNSIISGTVSGTINISNCLKIGDTFPISGINNNIENVPLADVFIVANPNVSNASLDNNFHLKATSPAIGAGNLGQNLGAFGGTDPYRLSGQPPVPIITNFFLSTTGSTASGLKGSITIQSNN